MKLSEAIRLGAMASPQSFGSFVDIYGTCAMGAAKLAVGKLGVPMLHIWPWLHQGPKRDCRDCRFVGSPFGVILHLNDYHRWTREAIAAWVATVEPQDIQNEQTDGGQATHPTELSRSDEVQNIGV